MRKHIIDSFNNSDFEPKRLLQVNSCGSEHITNHEYTVFRPNGRKDYHFLYVKSGWIDAELGEHKVHINAGQCMVFYPFTPQKYTFCYEGNPTTYYVHFTGAAAEEAMSYLREKEDMLYTIISKGDFEILFSQLIRTHSTPSPLCIPEENSLLLQLINLLIRTSMPSNALSRKEIAISTVYFQEHFNEEIDMKKYAKELNLSYSRFAHMFTDQIGISPHKYILQYRISKAAELLMTSSLNVSEISENVGFQDSLYFSRMFRKHMGMSPTEYRHVSRHSR